jgi:hypothetical protein
MSDDEEEGEDEAEGFLNGLEEEMRAREGGEGDEVDSSGEGNKRKRAEDFSELDHLDLAPEGFVNTNWTAV